MIRYEPLTENDAAAYRNLRLEALMKSPEAFASEYPVEVQYSLSDFEERLSRDHAITIGAFDGKSLIGIVTLVKEILPKMRHRATLEAVYVKPEYRGRRISRQMIEKLTEIAKDEGIVKKFYLYVMVSNEHAISAYEKMGFSIYGEDKEAMWEGDHYVDEYLMARFI
ncbi:GNAT family N-acetyltransferase [Sporolactobacillus pectinivorans]|uniref:GNAT family N-acetyltransferase n=1 Tax=Sporolactobacillus pectinivorans TaxID=1591408 RepID=UPI0012FE37E3|nr:GNAT family N-acetyltransferase [Sporolactobacillus pectinivorans]